MKKRKINVTIMKEETGYSAYATVGEKFISTQAETLQDLKSNMLDATKLSFKGRRQNTLILNLTMKASLAFIMLLTPRPLSDR